MKIVPTRKLGASGLDVAALSLGSWHTWDRSPFEETVRVIRRAIDAGANFFDVGVYRGPDPNDPGSPTDIIFSHALEAAGVNRDDYTLSVKSWLFGGGAPKSITDQHDQALFRIGTDHSDVVVFGDDLYGTVDYAQLVDGIGQLIANGKTKAWGVNNWAASEIRTLADAAKAASVSAPSIVQLKYNIARRSIAEGEPYHALAADIGISIQASDAVEGGALLGNKITRMTAGDPGGIRGEIVKAVPRLQSAADEFDCSIAQLCLAFLLTNDDLSTILVGARTTQQLADNLGAFDVFTRVGKEKLRAAAEPFWFDKDKVDPNASWSAKPNDDPATYQVILPDPIEV